MSSPLQRWTFEKVKRRMSDQITKLSSKDPLSIQNEELRQLIAEIRTNDRRYTKKGHPNEKKLKHVKAKHQRKGNGELVADHRKIAIPIDDEIDVVPNDQAGVNHNQVVVNQEQAVVNRDQAVMNHDQVVVNNDQAVINNDQAVVNQEQAVVNRDQAVVNQEQAVVNRDQAVVNHD
ncbi:Hypothetical predicted protein [Mytilus galloprovincialis]|uniref:Uncharacterized protein n=1 Tax=Mytilus galloprovincialis TaxID=29158 RepID=A0A8B6CRD9_MYTGA|nr:Hypothetical predicted protein [Mytilus galloprovincialis]